MAQSEVLEPGWNEEGVSLGGSPAQCWSWSQSTPKGGRQGRRGQTARSGGTPQAGPPSLAFRADRVSHLQKRWPGTG